MQYLFRCSLRVIFNQKWRYKKRNIEFIKMALLNRNGTSGL